MVVGGGGWVRILVVSVCVDQWGVFCGDSIFIGGFGGTA